MHRIDGADNVANLFSDNGPGPATVVTDDWLNDVQEELCNLLEAMGVALVKGDRTQLRDACVSAATALKIVRRDAAGRAKVADPASATDIDTQGARDAAITAHSGVTNPHSATSAATASRLVLRDASGRTKMADPAAADDVATKGYVDTLVDGAFVAAGTWSPAPGGANIRKTSSGRVLGKFVVTAGVGDTSVVGTIAAGCRPSTIGVYTVGMNITDGTLVGISVSTAGVVTIASGYVANKQYGFVVTYDNAA